MTSAVCHVTTAERRRPIFRPLGINRGSDSIGHGRAEAHSAGATATEPLNAYTNHTGGGPDRRIDEWKRDMPPVQIKERNIGTPWHVKGVQELDERSVNHLNCALFWLQSPHRCQATAGPWVLGETI